MTQVPQELKTQARVRVTNDVIAAIAGIAAIEVQGVSAMSGGLAGGITERFGKKSLGRGVRLEMKDTNVNLDLYVVVRYGYKIPEVASRIQSRVKETVETMTGLRVSDVNIHVQGVSFEECDDTDAVEPNTEP
jgi:uncharacterized alkaline shock family protein YloU